ncbi:MAG: geranylgeranylglyceryl/heptaprenylglyceryl phosphate synthase [Crocinitomicaceae bacterium]
MNSIQEILENGDRKLAILIDPDKTKAHSELENLLEKIKALKPTFIFVGGSTVDAQDIDQCIAFIKKHTAIPVVIFPGSHQQVNEKADAILFLSLLSGRNPDYLIGHQVESAHLLKKMQLETISTAYLLIDGGKNSSVAYVSQTSPIPSDQEGIAIKTAIAGEMLGFKCVFMDAGSGAINPVPVKMIKAVRSNIQLPIIIGGGIRSIEELDHAYEAGANLVVIGNKIEEDSDFLLDLIGYSEMKK